MGPAETGPRGRTQRKSGGPPVGTPGYPHSRKAPAVQVGTLPLGKRPIRDAWPGNHSTGGARPRPAAHSPSLMPRAGAVSMRMARSRKAALTTPEARRRIVAVDVCVRDTQARSASCGCGATGWVECGPGKTPGPLRRGCGHPVPGGPARPGAKRRNARGSAEPRQLPCAQARPQDVSLRYDDQSTTVSLRVLV